MSSKTRHVPSARYDSEHKPSLQYTAEINGLKQVPLNAVHVLYVYLKLSRVVGKQATRSCCTWAHKSLVEHIS